MSRFSNMSMAEIEEVCLQEDEARAREEVKEFEQMDEQEQILQIALREIAHENKIRELDEVLGEVLGEVEDAVIVEIEDDPRVDKDTLVQYATGIHPSMKEVQASNKTYPAYGVWDKDGYKAPDYSKSNDSWRDRFGKDGDGVCDDPYGYYNGNFY